VSEVPSNIEKETLAKIKKCDLIKDFEGRLSCKSKLLNDVTKVQDTVNLNIMGDFCKTNLRCSEDPRWLSVHIVDNANAIILGISNSEFNPDRFWHKGSYVDEKITSFIAKTFRLKPLT